MREEDEMHRMGGEIVSYWGPRRSSQVLRSVLENIRSTEENEVLECKLLACGGEMHGRVGFGGYRQNSASPRLSVQRTSSRSRAEDNNVGPSQYLILSPQSHDI